MKSCAECGERHGLGGPFCLECYASWTDTSLPPVSVVAPSVQSGSAGSRVEGYESVRVEMSPSAEVSRLAAAFAAGVSLSQSSSSVSSSSSSREVRLRAGFPVRGSGKAPVPKLVAAPPPPATPPLPVLRSLMMLRGCWARCPLRTRELRPLLATTSFRGAKGSAGRRTCVRLGSMWDRLLWRSTSQREFRGARASADRSSGKTRSWTHSACGNRTTLARAK